MWSRSELENLKTTTLRHDGLIRWENADIAEVRPGWPGGALLAASPRLALACQSAVALAELIEREVASIGKAAVFEAARALGQEARQALAQAGCRAGAGDE